MCHSVPVAGGAHQGRGSQETWGGRWNLQRNKQSNKVLRKKVRHEKENFLRIIKLNNLIILRFVMVLMGMRGKELSFAVSSLG